VKKSGATGRGYILSNSVATSLMPPVKNTFSVYVSITYIC
jgi:hypothetical protein